MLRMRADDEAQARHDRGRLTCQTDHPAACIRSSQPCCLCRGHRAGGGRTSRVRTGGARSADDSAVHDDGPCVYEGTQALAHANRVGNVVGVNPFLTLWIPGGARHILWTQSPTSHAATTMMVSFTKGSPPRHGAVDLSRAWRPRAMPRGETSPPRHRTGR
jgi:hypothetical protein